MGRTDRKLAPLLVLLALLAGLTALLGSWVYRATDSHLIYTLDDPYIHMAIARHFVRDGSWSVTGQGFTSSSSSPLWTLLVSAGYALVGVCNWWPLALNVLAGAALAVVAYRVLLRNPGAPGSPWLAGLGAAVAILLGPVAPVMFAGLEHILHTTFVLAAVFLACGLLDPLQSTPERPRQIALAVLCALAMMARYESMFLIFVLCVLFGLRRQVRFALALGFISALPVLVAGLISKSHDWFFLPNSVLMKGRHLSFTSMKGVVESLGGYGLSELARAPHLGVMLVVAVAALAVLVRRQGTIWRRQSLMLLVFLAVTLLHLQFAAVAWFYRYECYLVVLGCVAFAAVAPEMSSLARSLFLAGPRWRRVVAAVVTAWLLFFPAQRAAMAIYETPMASRNIYEQQYQMGLFFRQFYTHQAIALNDIGAVNYLADVKCLDLYGLANREVLGLILQQRFGPREMDGLIRRFSPKLIAIYTADFGRLPPDYIVVAHWIIRDNVVCGSDVVDFYALDPSEALAAQQHMRQFAFPKAVDVVLEPVRK